MLKTKTFLPGTFLYKLDKVGIIENNPVFIHDGYITADGYGVLIGFTSDDKLLKSTGFGNYCYGGEVRMATIQEIEKFINRVHNYSDSIKNY
jgi:hypothetical protein